METGKVRAWYDKEEDIFYMLFKIWNAQKSGLIKQVAKAIAEATS